MSKNKLKVLTLLSLIPIISSCSLFINTTSSDNDSLSSDINTIINSDSNVSSDTNFNSESYSSDEINNKIISSITFNNSTDYNDYNLYNLDIIDFEYNAIYTDVNNYLRLGSSSKNGSIVISFKSLNVNSIYIYGEVYKNDTYSDLKLTLNNLYSYNDRFNNNYLKFNLDKTLSISSLELETSSIGRRFNLSKIEFRLTNNNSSSDSSNSSTNSNSNSSSLSSDGSNNNVNYKIVDKYVVESTILDIDPSKYEDPYEDYNSSDIDEFYNNYTISTSYIDSYYRSKHNLLSGEYILEDGSINEINKPKDDNNLYYKNALVRYEVDNNGNYISYTINNLYGNDYKIYYGGLYTSINDVSAYLFAFNEVPKNYYIGSKETYKKQAYNEFGELGRVNFATFSGPTSSKYQYEPYLKGQKEKSLYYREIDFGANTGSNYYYTYNDRYNGNNSREVFRFLLSNSYDSSYTGGYGVNSYTTPNPTRIDDRYVYFTQNHYNDFREYLNYYNGWGTIFGNVTAGNSLGKYNSSNPPTEFEDTTLALFN